MILNLFIDLPRRILNQGRAVLFAIDLCCEVLGNGALSDQVSELSKLTVLKLRASAWVAGSLRQFSRGSDIRVPGCSARNRTGD